MIARSGAASTAACFILLLGGFEVPEASTLKSHRK
jgi:hypothetical protein